MAGDTAGSTVADTSSTPCDVYALACELKDELAAIEERQEKAKDFAERLEHQRRELQGQLYELELAEDEEKTATKTLKEELARAGSKMFGPSWTRNSESTADLEGSALLSMNRILDENLPPQLAARSQMATAMRYFFKGSTTSQPKQPDEAGPSKQQTTVDENAPPTNRSKSFGKAKARTMKRILSEKIRRKVSVEMKTMPRKIRKVSKSGEASRLIRRKTLPPHKTPPSQASISQATYALPVKKPSFGLLRNVQIA